MKTINHKKKERKKSTKDLIRLFDLQTVVTSQVPLAERTRRRPAKRRATVGEEAAQNAPGKNWPGLRLGFRSRGVRFSYGICCLFKLERYVGQMNYEPREAFLLEENMQKKSERTWSVVTEISIL